MKLKEFIVLLNQFVEENPEALDKDCYTSIDSEGNGYNCVYYAPSIGHMDSRGYEEISEAREIAKDKGKEFNEEEFKKGCNAVVLN